MLHEKISATRIEFIEPMYALGVRSLSEGPDWLYEIKLDGYRCITGRNSSGVNLWSRRGNLFTAQFPAIAEACKKLPPGTLVDGGIVALHEHGQNSFNLLQHHRSNAFAIRYYLFDLLVHRGKSLINAPLSERRASLPKLKLPSDQDSFVLSETIDASVPDLIRAAKELSLEGIIAKRKDLLYESAKRTGAWVKYKINKGQEFVIGGHTPGNPFDVAASIAFQ